MRDREQVQIVVAEQRIDRSPWIGADRVSRCGALEIGSAKTLNGSLPVGPQFPGLAARDLARRVGTILSAGIALTGSFGPDPRGR